MGFRKRYTEDEKTAARARDTAIKERADATLADEAQMIDIMVVLANAGQTVTKLSLRNQVMLAVQAAERGIVLTDVATYRGWLVRGRGVVKGQAGLRQVSYRGAEKLVDEHGNESGGRRFFAFDSVFDIAQTEVLTDDDPRRNATAATPPADADAEPVVSGVDKLAEQITGAGYTIEYGAENTAADHDTHVVRVGADVAPDAIAAALGVALAAILTRQRVTGDTAPAVPTADTPDEPDTVTLDLGPAYGRARVHVDTNWDNGRTRYTVRAPRVTGSFTIMAGRVAWNHELRPEAVDVEFGDLLTGSDYHDGYRYAKDAPVINGIQLIGLCSLEPERLFGGELRWISGSRLTGRYSSERAPDATNRRLSAVVRAIALHWLAREDLEQVREAGHRHQAPARQRERAHLAGKLGEQIAALEAKRNQAQGQAAAYGALIDNT